MTTGQWRRWTEGAFEDVIITEGQVVVAVREWIDDTTDNVNRIAMLEGDEHWSVCDVPVELWDIVLTETKVGGVQRITAVLTT